MSEKLTGEDLQKLCDRIRNLDPLKPIKQLLWAILLFVIGCYALLMHNMVTITVI